MLIVKQSTPSILVGDILLSIDGVEVPEALDQSQVAQVAQASFVVLLPAPLILTLLQSFLGPENSTVMLGLCRPLKIPIDPSQLEVTCCDRRIEEGDAGCREWMERRIEGKW
eukprot:671904-Hanusia_phi.AAC.2